ncbi:hypothetical protein BJ741DRAFT_645432 [Chytriomyces cf. hyalinus JEL632]|nr:hypothetical protein BJ741DRAFT_645432 [Chytriomyces cf. hyalinus JEL632]
MSAEQRSFLLPAMVSVAAAAVTLLTYLYRDETIFSTGRSKQKLPRVGKHVPFFGDLFTVIARIDDIQDFYLETFEKSNNATVVLKVPFYPNNYIFNNPEILEFVLKSNFPVFEKRLCMTFLGDGIFNADGESWRTQRKLASNIFNVKVSEKSINKN